MTKAARAISIGKKYLGRIQYKLGAKCPVGKTLADCKFIDCSGFVRECFKEAGVDIIDGSQQQKAACREVPLELALGPTGAGCLLFMSPKPGNKWPRHVGISLGNGKSLESCSGSGVSIRERKNWMSAGKYDSIFKEE